MLQDLFGTLVSPRATMTRLRGAPPVRGLGPVLLAGAGWAAFSATLAAGGYEPSRPAPAIDPSVHYLLQAFFVTPLFIACWGALTATTAFVARRYGATSSTRELAAPLAFAYGVPLFFVWALPDAAVFAARGFEALGPAVRFIGPASALAMGTLGALAVRTSTGLSWSRACVAAFAGLVAQGAVGGWALR